MFYSHQLLARKASLRQWMAATMHAKIHRGKLDKLNNCEEILNPSVPMARRLSGILMDNVTRVLVEINEAWKVKSAPSNPTRLPKGAKSDYPQLGTQGSWGSKNPPVEHSLSSASFSTQPSHARSFHVGSYNRHLHTSKPEKTARIVADGAFRWTPKQGGAGGWLQDVTSGDFLEGFQVKGTGIYKYPCTHIFEYYGAEHGIGKALDRGYVRLIFCTDSATLYQDFKHCLERGCYPKEPHLSSNDEDTYRLYREKLLCYRSLTRILKRIPPGTPIKLEKISGKENKLSDALAQLGLVTEKNKSYKSVIEIQNAYKRARADQIAVVAQVTDEKKKELPEIKDAEWKNFTKFPATLEPFLVWKPK